MVGDIAMKSLGIESGTEQHGVLLSVLRAAEGQDVNAPVIRAAYRLVCDYPMRAADALKISMPAAAAIDRRQLLVVDAASEQSWLTWESDLSTRIWNHGRSTVLRLVPVW